MDVVEYVNTQANLLAAKLTALAITSPTVQTAADLYRTAKDYFGPEAMAVIGLAATRFGPDLSLVHLADPGFTGAEAQAFDHSVMLPAVDPVTDMALDVADSYAMAGRSRSICERSKT
jgi:hypothetical protein